MMRENAKYQTVYTELSRMAATARPGEKLPSIKELCRRFQVSLATLNSALDLLAQDGRIRREPKRGIYFLAESEVERNWKVALVLPGDHEPLFVAIITTLHRCFREHAVELSLVLYDLNPIAEAREIARLRDDAAYTGVLYLPLFRSADTLAALKALAAVKPVIQLDRQLEEHITPFVGYECYEACYAATRYLIEHGHHNIGLIRASNDDEQKPSERLAGFQDAMRDSALAVQPKNTIVYDVYHPDLCNGVVEILSSAHCPTAFYAVNSVYLPQLMRKANFAGKRIPEDLSVICCDLSDTMEQLPLAITHYAQPTREAVVRAAELLLAQMRGEVVEAVPIRLPARLVEGESCRTLVELQAQGMN